MEFSLLTLLVILIALGPLWQPNWERFFPAFIFAVFTAGHEVLCVNLDGLAYYGSAAAFDAMTVFILAAVGRSTFALCLQFIATASLALNATGWALWVSYAPPDLYNGAFVVLYGVTVMILFLGEPHAWRERKKHYRIPWILRSVRACRISAVGIMGKEAP